MKKTAAREYLAAIFVAVLVAFSIRFFVIEAFKIPGDTMVPSLVSGDTIFVSKWPFGLRVPWSKTKFTQGRRPSYGDVVVFSIPQEHSKEYIRRVIGLPGDHVEIRSSKVFLNGRQVTQKEDNTNCGTETLPSISYAVCWENPVIEQFGPQKIPEGSVFVLNDYRTQGKNRSSEWIGWGIVPLSTLNGKALWIWLSIEPIGLTDEQGKFKNWFSRIRFERMFHSVR